MFYKFKLLASSIVSSILLRIIKCYRMCFSPFLGNNCRFFPTCSDYAEQAILKHGPLKGCFFAVFRLLKCNPFNPGGFDPVP